MNTMQITVRTVSGDTGAHALRPVTGFRGIARVFILLGCLGVAGCATTDLRFTSNPPGAKVYLRKMPPPLPVVSEERSWGQPKGTTPCTVSVPARDGYCEARIMLRTNEVRKIQLVQHQPRMSRMMGLASPAAVPAGASTGGALICLGCVGLAALATTSADQGSDYDQQEFHVDFSRKDAGWTSSFIKQYVPFPSQAVEVENPDRCRIYVMRSKPMNSFIMTVRDGDVFIGDTGPRSYFCWEREAGRMTLTSKAENRSTVTLDLEKGRVYYFIQHVQLGGWSVRNALERVDEAEGLLRLRECGAPTYAPP